MRQEWIRRTTGAYSRWRSSDSADPLDHIVAGAAPGPPGARRDPLPWFQPPSSWQTDAMMFLAMSRQGMRRDQAGGSSAVLDPEQLEFVETRRTATLVTLSDRGRPRPVPICFVLVTPDPGDGSTLLYSPLDEKPKHSRDVRDLARVRDIAARPEVTLLFERWSEDWSQLAWLRAHGRARLVEPGDDAKAHESATRALRVKYAQYRAHRLERAPMIRITLETTVAWSAAAGRAPRTG
jgi:PPOX class probable F420-dependent enzyme